MITKDQNPSLDLATKLKWRQQRIKLWQQCPELAALKANWCVPSKTKHCNWTHIKRIIRVWIQILSYSLEFKYVERLWMARGSYEKYMNTIMAVSELGISHEWGVKSVEIQTESRKIVVIRSQAQEPKFIFLYPVILFSLLISLKNKWKRIG